MEDALEVSGPPRIYSSQVTIRYLAVALQFTARSAAALSLGKP